MNYEDELTAKVAWYYYCQEQTQMEISERLGISRMRVLKLLNKARRTGMIRFQVRQGFSERTELEHRLIGTYGIKDAFVVPAASHPEECNANVAQAACMYLAERMDEGAVINIGYGDTLSRVLNLLATSMDIPLTCLSLTGGVNPYLPDTRSSVFNAKLHLMPAPLFASSAQMAEAMMSEEGVQGIMRMLPLSQFTVVGIGAVDESATIFRAGILNGNDMTFLKMQGVVGDLLSHFIAKDGTPVESPLEHRLIGIGLDMLRKQNNVIGVAAGEVKAGAIRAVLTGKYISTLITDDRTAERVLNG